ncbi:unnamed protein product [Chrysoparadoxa australica]
MPARAAPPERGVKAPPPDAPPPSSIRQRPQPRKKKKSKKKDLDGDSAANPSPSRRSANRRHSSGGIKEKGYEPTSEEVKGKKGGGGQRRRSHHRHHRDRSKSSDGSSAAPRPPVNRHPAPRSKSRSSSPDEPRNRDKRRRDLREGGSREGTRSHGTSKSPPGLEHQDAQDDWEGSPAFVKNGSRPAMRRVASRRRSTKGSLYYSDDTDSEGSAREGRMHRREEEEDGEHTPVRRRSGCGDDDSGSELRWAGKDEEHEPRLGSDTSASASLSRGGGLHRVSSRSRSRSRSNSPCCSSQADNGPNCSPRSAYSTERSLAAENSPSPRVGWDGTALEGGSSHSAKPPQTQTQCKSIRGAKPGEAIGIKPIIMEPSRIPLHAAELNKFISSPLSAGPGVALRCFIERDRSVRNGLSQVYSIYADLEDGSGRRLMSARRIVKSKTAHYVICTRKEDLFLPRHKRDEKSYLGKLRGVGDHGYVLYDDGESPNWHHGDSDHEEGYHKDASKGEHTRQELAAVAYAFDKKTKKEGKRRMEVAIPKVSEEPSASQKHAVYNWQPADARSTMSAHFNRVRYQGAQNLLLNDKMLVMHQRESRYDPLSSCLVDFKGRATSASVKNVQLIESTPENNVNRVRYFSQGNQRTGQHQQTNLTGTSSAPPLALT